MAHISTQLQFRPEMTQALKLFVNEKEISAYAKQDSAYLNNLIIKIQHNKVESEISADGSKTLSYALNCRNTALPHERQ